jgi:uncharacterized protein (TIRG00374 family)
MTLPLPVPSEEHQEHQPGEAQLPASYQQQDSVQQTTKNRWISLAIRVGVTLLLFTFLLRPLSWSTLWAILAGANRGPMLLGLTAGAVGVVVSSSQWQGLLRSERITIGLLRLIRLYMMGIAFSHFLPTGMGGDAVKALYVGRESGNGPGSVSAIVMSRVTGFLGMLLVALPVLIIWFPHFTSAILVWFVLLSLLIASVVWTAIFSTTLAARVPQSSWIKNHLISHRILAFVVRIGNAIKMSTGRPRSLGVALVFGMLFWVIGCLNYYIYGIALHVDAPLYFYFVAIPFVSLVTVLPISINGFGVRESAFVYIFSTVQVPLATSLLLAFVMDAQILLFGAIGGYMYLMMSSKGIPSRSSDGQHSRESGVDGLHPEAKVTKPLEHIVRYEVYDE